MTVYTIGHSTRKVEEFIEVLRHYGIERLIDIRHFPGSRHNPQFARPSLEQALPAAGIDYVWIEKLGGFRKGGYHAHMETVEFREGLGELERLASEKPAAYCCTSKPWMTWA